MNANLGLTNVFLEKFLLPKCENFIGVYSVDKIPSHLWKKNCCCIINLSKTGHPGSHFIAIYINKQNELWYFDSYALPPPILNTHLMRFLKKWIDQNKIICVPSQQIQDFDSLFCGWYTAAFCLFVNLNHPMNFDTLFDKKNLRKNEKIVLHLVKSLCRKLRNKK